MWRSSVIAVCGLLSSSSVMAIMDVGYAHACATVGTTLKCWGDNKWGQLGRGDTDMTGDDPDEMGDDLVPVDLGTGEVASDIALGEEHTCVLLSSGDVKCFGHNDKGQLGQGDTMSRGQLPNQLGSNLSAIDLGTGVSAAQVTTGCEHTCVLLDDDSVKCFGYNNYGQLGQGTTDNIGDDADEMGDNLIAVPLGGASVIAISAGCDFSCAVLDDGDVMCWGRNTYGQLGTGDSEDLLDEADEEVVAVDLGESQAVGIAAGESHVCARLADATVKCWGRNNVGQLGLGDTTDRGDDAALLGGNLTAVQFGADDVPFSLDLGAFHSCALLVDRSIKCFGENGDGELGIGSTDNVGELPTDMGENLTAVDLGGTASDMAAGGSSSCAVLLDESIKCWGLGSSGQLGQGNDENIGDVPEVLADTAPIDLGTEVNITTASPTPSPLPLMTTPGPSSLPPTSEPSASPTTSPREATFPPVSASPTTSPREATFPPVSSSPTTSPREATFPPVSASPTTSPREATFPPVSASPTTSPREVTFPPVSASPTSSREATFPSASPTTSSREATFPPVSASPTTSSREATFPPVSASPITVSSAPSESAATMSPDQMMPLSPSTATETAMPTAAPTAAPTSTASGISVGGLLAAVVVGATGFLGVLFM